MDRKSLAGHLVKRHARSGLILPGISSQSEVGLQIMQFRWLPS